jgi:hypothetical protein
MATEAFKDTMKELHQDYLVFTQEVKHQEISLSFKEYVELYIQYLPNYNSLDIDLDDLQLDEEILLDDPKEE